MVKYEVGMIKKYIEEHKELTDKSTLLHKKESRRDEFGNITTETVYHYNFPITFDTETTSCYTNESGRQYTNEEVRKLKETGTKEAKEELDGLAKVGFVYIWMACINSDLIIYSRDIKQVTDFVNELAYALDTNDRKQATVWVHNLGFDFQFIYRLIEWDNEGVFATSTTSPIYAQTKCGIVFRDSYILYNESLASISKTLGGKFQKRTGDLDYSKIRHSETPLTDTEMGYCEMDVLSLSMLIENKIKEDEGITKIPLTNTGYVRNHCRQYCLYGKGRGCGNTYKTLIDGIRIDGADEYRQLKRAFMGGFTHANMLNSEKTIANVGSYDETSAYPGVILTEEFPMSRGHLIKKPTPAQINHHLTHNCCVFECILVNVRAKSCADHPISKSKCYIAENVLEDNGRVIKASRLVMTLTNVDIEYLKLFYDWDGIGVFNLRWYKKGRLPSALIQCLSEFYKYKTTLKGVTGTDEYGRDIEKLYMKSKGMLNAMYGMMVQDIINEEIIMTDWGLEKAENEMTSEEYTEKLEEEIEKYNNKRNRFLCYQWGVFVTAYARKNLLTMIAKIGGSPDDGVESDYIYADTDSIKFKNPEKYHKYFEEYNTEYIEKIKSACKFHKIPEEAFMPKTKDGVTKPIGLWDFEGVYDKFKTLGAKRYMVEEEDDIKITIAGVNKKSGGKYLKNMADPFEAFKDGLSFDVENSGKNTHTYFHGARYVKCIDFTGQAQDVITEAGVHLEPVAFSMKISKSYRRLLDMLMDMGFDKQTLYI